MGNYLPPLSETLSASITPAAITSLTLACPSLALGQTITPTAKAGTLTATASYQWYRSSTKTNNTSGLTAIGTGSTYQITADDAGYYIICSATGTGNFDSNTTVSTVTDSAVAFSSITGITVTGYSGAWDNAAHGASVSGTQAGDTVSYSANGTSGWTTTPITRTAHGTSTVYVKVSRAGYNDEIYGPVSIVITAATGTFTLTPDTESAIVGEKITVSSTLTIANASISSTATDASSGNTKRKWEWYRVDPTSSVATKITTATTGVYMPSTDDLGYKLRVVVSSDANNYTGTATYNFATVTVQNLGGLSFDNNHPIYSAGYAAGNATIVATPSPSGATATYQWYQSNGSGTDTAISGATSNSYQAVAGDLGYYLKCVATGTGNYIGSVNHTSAIVQQKFIAPVLSVANSSSDPTGSLVVTFTTSETAETNATLECSTDQSTWTEVETKKESGSYSFTKGSLTANTTYYFRAKLNGSGNYVSSEYSAVVSGVTSTSTVDIDVSGGQVTSPVVYGNTFQIGNVKLENIGNVDATGVIVYFFVATTQQEINSLVQASTPSGYIATATIGDIDRGAIRRAESGTISTSSLSVGDYYVGWRAIANETDSDLTNNYGVAVSQLTITAATGGWAVTSSQTFTYDGNAHSATITGAENATVEYGPLSSGPWSSTPITRTDVGHTDFYVKVSQANYTTTTTLVSVVISAKPLTIVASANSKVYDGTTSATGTLSIASGGVVSGDEVTVSGGVGTFADKNVGTNKTVTFTGYTLTGAQSSNYTKANNSATATANITTKSLSATGVEVEDKIYNRATDALLADGWEVPGIASGDDCTCTPTATFAQSDASDSPIATTVTFALSGDDAGNYTTPGDVTGTAMIHPKQLTISGTAVANKSYDGTTDATATAGTLFGVEDGDTVTVAIESATFESAGVGNNKNVTVTYSISEE